MLILNLNEKKSQAFLTIRLISWDYNFLILNINENILDRQKQGFISITINLSTTK
jgi:hypothetical protein